MVLLFEPLRQRASQLGPVLGAGLRIANRPEDLHRALAADPTEVLVVFGPGTDARDALHFAAQQRPVRPALGVVLLRDRIDATILGCALRAGVRDVVDVANPEVVRAACAHSQRISRQLATLDATPESAVRGRSPAGRLVTVFAAKGGCGKSTLATNLAVALADAGRRRVILVDLDLTFGDVGIMMQLLPKRSIADAIGRGSVMDDGLLRSLLTPHSAGLDVLLAPVGPTEAERVTRDVVDKILTVATSVADFVVVDTPAQFTEHVLTSLDLSHLHLLLATPDVPALKNLRVTLDMLDLLRLSASKRLVILNRSDAKVGLTSADIDRVIHVPTSALVPSSREVPISINKGIPIVLDKPNHPVSKAIRELARGKVVPKFAATPQPASSRRPIPAAGSR
jgi:pilus assembly protein CpaE